jgi:hypothetical protein
VEVMSDKDMTICFLEKLLTIEGIDILKQSGIMKKKHISCIYTET